MDCRLEQINMGKPTKIRCDICGLFGRCTKGLDSHIPIPVDKDAEITRLKEQLARTERERDQAEGAGSLHIATITEDNASEIYDGWRNTGKTVILGIGATEKFIAGYEESEPDLYAYLAGKVNG